MGTDPRMEGRPRCVLFLDYDGTLAPFRVARLEATPFPGVRRRLGRLLAGRSTRVVIVSGRTVDDLRYLLRLDPLPELWGAHGWEHQPAGGEARVLPLPEAARNGLREAEAWARAGGLGERLERKPGCLALHWRGVSPDVRDAMHDSVRAGWGALAAAGGLELTEFDGGIELRVPGRDKGDAVRAVLETIEWREGVLAAFLGDDRTDEDAFSALKQSLGERALNVLVRDQWRESCADAWLRPPACLRRFLDRWIALE